MPKITNTFSPSHHTRPTQSLLTPSIKNLSSLPSLTRQEVSKHDSKCDAYVIVDNLVYDISNYGMKHPGGDVIYEMAGKDASLPFRAYHPDYVYEKWLKSRLVGKVAEEDASGELDSASKVQKKEPRMQEVSAINAAEGDAETKADTTSIAAAATTTESLSNAERIQHLDNIYFNLYQRLEKEGIFHAKWYWYAFKIIYSLLIFASGLIVAFGKIHWVIPALKGTEGAVSVLGYQITRAMVDSIWFRGIFAGFLIGLGQHQVAFICHDSAHCSVWSNWSFDYSMCLFLANSIFGVSTLWWKYTHNQHHVVTNEWDRDPDITHVPIFVVTKGQYLHPKGLKMNLAQKVLLYLSPLTFLPIVMFIARFSMYWQGVYMLFILGTVPTMPWQKLHLPTHWLTAERVMTTFYFVWWFLLLRQLPSWQYIVTLIVASHLTTGALHIQLTLSHYDRPNVFSKDKPMTSWFEQQVITGRNIEGNITNEWIFGGLHYQIEHHLFPRAPRHSHRTIKKYVRQICDEYNIEYSTGGFWSALGAVLFTVVAESRYAFRKPFKEGVYSLWSKMDLN
uniref:Cytochrome b5 heme-binding domain-containing protein n=1 Tax=Percolomonas cosmopolitus TaxID=63605 RepID=A0A7S1KRD7_9EUKA|mmetsp:Transcript_6324/g.23835  ORF Transcript_6324/g.23835 Transcript_6324/m.23835 type:complete len:563 (+) Transcript_6324:482-2170(+)|eukprot:CAMPEP_0117440154 /NCGR_PEP_ID=MMETSP0759-20121206/2936_1 /TAXON_ID=63605 /ORGANISM="Percolomonas cosmopolitus, Strain WS" /LENGTH=562 /DNA_ID=CAMNT_0005231895 /DNA_START=805 /DNA_END=2493 /DNA_ORIENTATION=-